MLKLKTDESKLVLTNRHKVFWPGEGYTKGDLLDYYREIAQVIVPHLKDRPQIMHRHVDGQKQGGKEFFQRISRDQPCWLETVSIKTSKRSYERRFILCQNWPSLLWLANFGCVELIPWTSRVGSLDYPDYMVIDLDPQGVRFDQVVEVAQAVRKILDGMGADSYCKTSGKRGLHIYVPLGARYFFNQSKLFAEIVCRLVHARLPDLTTLNQSIAQRQGRVYLDHSRNSRGQAMAAPYCARPWAGATVSTPLKWSEVRRGLDPGRFTIKSMPRRIEKLGDLWEPVLGRGIDLEKRLGKVDGLLNEVRLDSCGRVSLRLFPRRPEC